MNFGVKEDMEKLVGGDLGGTGWRKGKMESYVIIF